MIDAHFHYGTIADPEFHQGCITEIEEVLANEKIDTCLLHIIDEGWKEKSIHKLEWGNKIIPSFILNPLEDGWRVQLELLIESDYHFVKILPYEQGILRADYDKVLLLARELEKYNICLVVCSSYGSELIYETNGVELAAYLLRHGIKTPIVIAHGGMVKVLDALSLLETYPNVYIDLSYAIPYWYGSTLIQDYAFTIQKVKGKHIFYGSDYPYISLEDSKHAFDKMCQEYQISDVMREQILHQNFEDFLIENGWC